MFAFGVGDKGVVTVELTSGSPSDPTPIWQGLHRPYPGDEPGIQIIEANYSRKHPNYRWSTQGSDLMLIKLSRPAVESNTIQTISVASRCPMPGTMCSVSGWGQLMDGEFAVPVSTLTDICGFLCPGALLTLCPLSQAKVPTSCSV